MFSMFVDSGLKVEQPEKKYSEDELFEVEISDLSITNIGFAVFLKPKSENSSKVVPIFIGPLETHSISTALDGSTPERPNSHDLFIQLFEAVDIHIVRIVIDNIDGSLFYASISLKEKDRIHVVDSRPSDAIAIALRSQCPIYIHQKVYEKAAVTIGANEKDQNINQQQVNSKVENLRNQLQQAVEQELFEKAAQLRDQIKKIESEN